MAYVSIRHYEGLDPNRTDQLVERLEAAGLPNMVSNIPGFMGYFVFVDDEGTGGSVNIFKTQAGIEESNRQAAETIGDELMDLLPNPPEVLRGELVIQGTAE